MIKRNKKSRFEIMRASIVLAGKFGWKMPPLPQVGMGMLALD